MNDQDWAWRITWRGKQWTDADLTAQHVAVLVMLNGRDDWLDLNMEQAVYEAKAGVIDGPLRLTNMICALVSVDRTPEGTPEDEAEQITAEAIAEVRKEQMVAVLNAIEFNRP